MKRLSYLLAFGWVAISLINVGRFLVDGIGFGLTGWIVSAILALTIYASAYYLKPKQTRWPAGVVMLLAMVADLALNELEVTRELGAMTITEGNFLAIPPQILTYAYQIAALGVGALQTIFAAGLGWLQAGVDRLPTKNAAEKAGWFERIFSQADDVNGYKPSQKTPGAADSTKGFNASQNGETQQGGGKPALETAGERRRNELTAAEREAVSAMTPRQIVANFGGSIRRAREWKAAARDGEL